MNSAMDDPLYAALMTALEGDPGNVALRCHVVEQLLTADSPAKAFELARQGLTAAPAEVSLLALAASSASRAGFADEAAGYQTLLTALGGALSDGHATTNGTTPTTTPVLAPDDKHHLAERTPESVGELLDIWEDAEAPHDPGIGELTRSALTWMTLGVWLTSRPDLRPRF